MRRKVHQGERCVAEGMKCCKFNQSREQGTLKAARQESLNYISTVITNGDFCAEVKTDPEGEKCEMKLKLDMVDSVIKVKNYTSGKTFVLLSS